MRESNQLEFKEKVTNTFLKTVVAFSNYYGGKIVFGVNDFGESIGIKNIFTLNVSPGIETPYFYKSKTFRRREQGTCKFRNFRYNRVRKE